MLGSGPPSTPSPDAVGRGGATVVGATGVVAMFAWPAETASGVGGRDGPVPERAR